MRFISSFLLLSFACHFFISCSSDPTSRKSLNLNGSFSEAKLTQHQVFELKARGTRLYAGTDTGLFRQTTGSDNWQAIGPEGAKVQTFVILSNQIVLASSNIHNRDSLTIAKTTTNGQTWVPFRNEYSGKINRRIPTTMVIDRSNTDILLAGGPGAGDIAQSTDKGKTWELISGSWENLGFLEFLEINKNNSNSIWAGGANSLFEPYLIHSTDGGNTWQNIVILEHVETTVYNMAIDPSNPNRVLAGLGIGIRRSADDGQSWQTVFEQAGILAFSRNTKDPSILYAAGATPAGGLAFYASRNFGDSWETIEMENSPANIQVNDMVSVIEDKKEVLYFATNKGVYSYTFEE